MSEWTDGWRKLGSAKLGEIDYHFIVYKDTEFISTWGLRFVKGDWQAAKLDIVAGVYMDAGESITPSTKLEKILANFNMQIGEYFASISDGGADDGDGADETLTYAEQMEALLLALKINMVGGIPQVD